MFSHNVRLQVLLNVDFNLLRYFLPVPWYIQCAGTSLQENPHVFEGWLCISYNDLRGKYIVLLGKGNGESTESHLFCVQRSSDFPQCCLYHGEIFILRSNFKNIYLVVNNSLQFSPLLQFQCKKQESSVWPSKACRISSESSWIQSVFKWTLMKWCSCDARKLLLCQTRYCVKKRETISWKLTNIFL